MTQQLIYLLGAKILKITGYLVGSQILIQLIKAFSRKLKAATRQLSKRNIVQQQERIQTLRNLVVSSAKIIINFIAIMMILTELGVDIAPLLTGAGILGLAVGLGAKSLVADVLAGFFFILENQFNIGDTIDIGGASGKVVRLTLRTVTLRDKEGKTYIIPNSNIRYITKQPAGNKKKKSNQKAKRT